MTASGLIVRPITDDGLCGYDQHGQLTCGRPDPLGDPNRVEYVFVADVRAMTCIICGHGWESTAKSIEDQTRWDLVATSPADGYVHETCFFRHHGLVERQEFWSAIVAARVRFKGLRTLPNGYWPKAYRDSAKPWYEAELLDHPVKLVLGTRKRVDHVELVAQGGVDLSWWEGAKEAFKTEDVTKEFSPRGVLLHAWTREKMREYVRRLVDLGGYQVQRT